MTLELLAEIELLKKEVDKLQRHIVSITKGSFDGMEALARDMAELRRENATYKEDQRVSSEAFQFLHMEYRKALSILQQISKFHPGGGIGVVLAIATTALENLTELPPPDPAPKLPDAGSPPNPCA